MRNRIRTMACVAAMTLAVGAVGPAAADSDEGVELPSKQQVHDAETRADAKAVEVGRIKASLLLANQRLSEAAIAAERASEAYNGARWRLEQARHAVDQARADAAQARREVHRQRDAIGALVASSYQRGGELTALSAMMSADGPEGVLDQYVAFQGASSSLDADYQRFAASDALAEVFTRKAVAAQRRQRAVAAEAEVARTEAVSAADAAQVEAAGIAAEKDQLIRELASAQGISVRLARERQTALDEIARQRAAERARREAIAAAKAEARAQRAAQQAAQQAARQAARQAAQQAAQREAERKAAEERAAQEKAARGTAAEAQAAAEAATAAAAADEADKPLRRPDPEPRPTPSPTPPPAPAPPPAPPAGGAQAAISFATAQVGDPYRWGASGPDAWDCSGLTAAAWRAGGKSLPHYSVAQYHAGIPIGAGQLQPGDLVFWSSSSSPQGIHHVALYIGGGKIVHAPRTGRPVAVESMYYWVPPTHFVRP